MCDDPCFLPDLSGSHKIAWRSARFGEILATMLSDIYALIRLRGGQISYFCAICLGLNWGLLWSGGGSRMAIGAVSTRWLLYLRLWEKRIGWGSVVIFHISSIKIWEKWHPKALMSWRMYRYVNGGSQVANKPPLNIITPSSFEIYSYSDLHNSSFHNSFIK